MVGRLTAQAGRRDELVAQLLRAAELLGEAPGCELYVVSISPTEPDDVWVFEAWRSKADHAASLSMPAIRDLISRSRPLIAAMADSIPLVPIGGRGLPFGT